MYLTLLWVAFALFVDGNSRGIGVPCDVNYPNLGSTDVNKKDPLRHMWWAKEPTWANGKYTLRTADGPTGNDPTTYIPDRWTTIYLRVHEAHKQHCGLVLYAENSEGNKVGIWAIPPKSGYHQPGDCVVHSNANAKSYLSTFKFSAPVGTGKITIKALVKEGLANPVKGAFYWPGAAGVTQHLELNEASPPGVATWEEGGYGESCTTVCENLGGTCDLDTMKSVGENAESLYNAVQSSTTCTKPLMAGCSGSSPAVTNDGCFFHDATCEPPAPELPPSRECTETCGNWPGGVGYCCIWTGHHIAENNNKCWCVTSTGTDTAVWSIYNGAWSLGKQADDTDAPTPAPPVKEEITCEMPLDWNRLGRRLCACTGVTKDAPPFTPDGNGGVNIPTQISQGDIPEGGNGYEGIPACVIIGTPCTDPGDGPLEEICCKSGTSVWGCRNCSCTEEEKATKLDDLVTYACESGLYDREASGSVKPSSSLAFAVALLSLLLLTFPSSSPCASTQGSGRFCLLMALLLCFLPSSHAHNWLTSPARGNEAGENNGFNGYTMPPCPQKSSRIHVQAGAGEKFPIEWAAGHGFGSFTYFAVIKAADEAKLVDHTFDLLDDYLSDAPSTDYLSEYPVHFVSTTPRTHALLENTNKADSYVWNPQNEQLSLGQRPDVFRNFGMESVFAKKASGRAQDQRAQYKSEKYPWLISVHKFTMQYDFPDDADTTMIEIPKEFPPGQYVIQYMWSGFFDCIDVNILDEPSTDFFGRGSGAGGSSFDRIDHCQYIDTYEGYEIVGDCIGIGANSDATECARVCNDGCEAIQVIQSTLNPLVETAGVFTGQGHLPSECHAAASANPTGKVCFGLKMGTPQVGPNYWVSGDPEDPVFYNSCVRRTAGWTFNQVCSSCGETRIDPGFIFLKQCISCSEMRNNARPGAFLPQWDFTDSCRHCDFTQG